MQVDLGIRGVNRDRQKRIIFHTIICILLLFKFGCTNQGQPDLTKFVDPFIGTGEHGHTYPGATVPFGMVQLSPDTREENWDGSSGYHYSDKTIMGFSHTHLSGTGSPDLCDVLFMPTIGDIQFVAGDENNSRSGYRSRFSHDNEEASPGYYKVFLDDQPEEVRIIMYFRVVNPN